MRALQSRLKSHSTTPSWAAWLPKQLQQTENSAGRLEALGSVQPALMPTDVVYMSQDTPLAVGPVNAEMPAGMVYMSQDASFVDIPIVDVFENQDTSNSNMCQPTTWTFQPIGWTTMPMEVVMPSEEGAYDNWSNDAYAYCVGQEQCYQQSDQGACEEQCYQQLDQVACQEDFYAGALKGKVWKFSRNANGTRLVQAAFQNASSDEEIMELMFELQGHAWEALKCPHANYALAEGIKVARNGQSQFIIDELTQYGPYKVVEAARHRYGCRIIQRLFESCTAKQMAQIVEILLSDSAQLMKHTFGHYVILHLFDYGSLDVVLRLLSALEEQVPTMNADGCIAAVMGKALEKTTIETMAQSDAGEKQKLDNDLAELIDACTKARHSLAVRLLHMPQRAVSMACSRYGSKAAKLALGLASDSERKTISAEFSRCMGKLRSSRYGRIVVNYLDGL
jgi:hypothetical protein